MDSDAKTSLDLDLAQERFAASTDLTVGLEEEFAILDPRTLALVPRFEQLRAAAAARDPQLNEGITGELISSEIEIVSGRGRGSRRRLVAPARTAGDACSPSPMRRAWRLERRARIHSPTTASST